MHNRISVRNLVAFVLAGGPGSRLYELTAHRSKPAVLLGKNMFLDFTISNIRNSGIRHTYVLTQYKSDAINTHLAQMNTENTFWNRFIRAVPAQQQLGGRWYEGTADAVYQNHQLLTDDDAEHVVILAGDHVVKIDIEQFFAHHLEQDADVTICGRLMPTEVAANNFGVMEINGAFDIIDFTEKPADPKEHPEHPGKCFGSMGMYILKKKVLMDALATDQVKPNSRHDFGFNIIPHLIESNARVISYDHATNIIPGEHENSPKRRDTYWKDVGTLDAYWETCMDLLGFDPDLDLYNPDWPIITIGDQQPMYKHMTTEDYSGPGDSKPRFMSAGGTIVTNPNDLIDVMLGRKVNVDKGAHLTRSIILDGSKIGEGARIINTIVDMNIIIPAGCIIGESEDDDRARSIRITEKGIRLVHAGSNL